MSRSIHPTEHAASGGGSPRVFRTLIRTITPVQFGVDIGVAAAFVLVAGPLSIGQSAGGPLRAAVLVSVLMAMALAVRRLSPGSALAIAWIGAILQMLAGVSPLVVNLAIFGVLYVTAAYGSRLVLWLGFTSTLVGAAAVTAYTFLAPTGVWQQDFDWGTLFIGVSIYVATAFAFALSWTIGMLVRTWRRARQTKSAQAVAEREVIIEQERGRIARDMHDVVAHSLAVVIAQADGARYAAKVDAAAAPDGTIAALETIANTARSALTDVRLLLTQLRHSEGAGPQPTLADLEQLYAQVRAAGVDLRVEVDPMPLGTPPAAVQLAVFRILQEALTNALRHGDGGPVRVRLAWLSDRVDLEVRNRIAPTSEPRATAPGHGLLGMSERANLVGGRVLAAPNPGGDYLVSAMFPIGALS